MVRVQISLSSENNIIKKMWFDYRKNFLYYFSVEAETKKDLFLVEGRFLVSNFIENKIHTSFKKDFYMDRRYEWVFKPEFEDFLLFKSYFIKRYYFPLILMREQLKGRVYSHDLFSTNLRFLNILIYYYFFYWFLFIGNNVVYQRFFLDFFYFNLFFFKKYARINSNLKAAFLFKNLNKLTVKDFKSVFIKRKKAVFHQSQYWLPVNAVKLITEKGKIYYKYLYRKLFKINKYIYKQRKRYLKVLKIVKKYEILDGTDREEVSGILTRMRRKLKQRKKVYQKLYKAQTIDLSRKMNVFVKKERAAKKGFL